MSLGLVTVAYIAAAILFILSLGGLSNPETARRGNCYGIVGMAIAVLATIFGRARGQLPGSLGADGVVGGAIGAFVARRVQMTQMPELVALPQPRRPRRGPRRLHADLEAHASPTSPRRAERSPASPRRSPTRPGRAHDHGSRSTSAS